MQQQQEEWTTKGTPTPNPTEHEQTRKNPWPRPWSRREKLTRKSRRCQQCREGKRSRKALIQQQQHSNTFYNTTVQKIHSHKQKLLKQDGFLADPSKQLWENKIAYLEILPFHYIQSMPSNMAVHNLCILPSSIPKGTISVLGLGINFCIKKPHPTNNFKKSLQRFK